ncbi:hypothetical protein GCM10028778_26450 [Barrientosiimonas marina]|uniref:Uncharacterized protein n=1 Tax=Lentibacillus kimchii TaxID=1542911 RepID=A0ABW2USJ4_9BACI
MAFEETCKACNGTGMQSDDEGWQYQCSACRGDGVYDAEDAESARVMSVDENNRLLD